MSDIKSCASLYSLQTEYMWKRMSFEDVIRFVKENGAEGFEILPDQMLKGAPDLSEETVKEWNRIVAEYGIKPVVADVFLNTNLYKNRTLTVRECVDLLVKEIKQASRLGIPLLRLVSMTPWYVLEPLLPYCEKYNVSIALEIHAGMAFDIPATREFIQEMKRLNSKYIGIVVDTGIFCRRFPRVVRSYETLMGTSPEVFDYIDTLFEQGADLHAVLRKNGMVYPPELEAAIKTDHDRMFVPIFDGYENYDFTALDEYMPYIKHFHFKLFEMTEEGVEYSMDYKGLLQYLHSRGYEGYVSTEYEGNRFTLPGTPIQEKQQVAAHLKYVNACLDEIYGR